MNRQISGESATFESAGRARKGAEYSKEIEASPLSGIQGESGRGQDTVAGFGTAI